MECEEEMGDGTERAKTRGCDHFNLADCHNAAKSGRSLRIREGSEQDLTTAGGAGVRIERRLLGWT